MTLSGSAKRPPSRVLAVSGQGLLGIAQDIERYLLDHVRIGSDLQAFWFDPQRQA
ncbi:MAG: hypothetical protein R3E50_14345 [Halioglobus sp.]